MNRNLSWKIFEWKGVPVYFHWSLLLVLITVFIYRYPFWQIIGNVIFHIVLVSIHELGHATICFRYNCTVFAINVHYLGGSCTHSGCQTEWEECVIAWGGILAQLLLLSLSLGLFAILNSAGINARGISFIYNKLVVFNLILIGLNLIPIQPLDGARAWKIIRLFPDWYGNHKPKKGLNRKKYLRELIEILNSHAEKPVKPKKIIDLPEYKKRKDRENQE